MLTGAGAPVGGGCERRLALSLRSTGVKPVGAGEGAGGIGVKPVGAGEGTGGVDVTAAGTRIWE